MAVSRRGDDVELDLEAGLDLHAPDRAAGRRIRHILPVDAVEHVVLDPVVDQRMHLHDPVERGAGGLQQQLQVLEDASRIRS